MPTPKKSREVTWTEEDLKKAMRKERETERGTTKSKSSSKRRESSRHREADVTEDKSKAESGRHRPKDEKIEDRQQRKHHRALDDGIAGSSKEERKHHSGTKTERRRSSSRDAGGLSRDSGKHAAERSRSKKQTEHGKEARRHGSKDERNGSKHREDQGHRRRQEEHAVGESGSEHRPRKTREEDDSHRRQQRQKEHRGDAVRKQRDEPHGISNGDYRRKEDMRRGVDRSDENKHSSEHRKREEHHKTSKDPADHHRHREIRDEREGVRIQGRERNMTVNSEGDTHKSHKENVQHHEADNAINDGSDGYDDDDFEDYDDEDFEDDVDDDGLIDNSDASDARQHAEMTETEFSGLAEVMKAISQENEQVEVDRHHNDRKQNDLQQRKQDAGSPPPVVSHSSGRINFVLAKQNQITQQAATRTRNRGKDLSRLIELDTRAIDLFDLAPMNEYELYMNSFGQSDSVQVHTQTGDDNMDREAQTDSIEAVSRWCQHGDDVRACGVGDAIHDPNERQATELLDLLINIDSMRLGRFLMKSSQVCLALLDEQTASGREQLSSFKETKTPYSEGHLVLHMKHPLIKGREFLTCCVSPVQSNLILVAYGPVTEKRESGALQSVNLSSLVCLWDAFKPAVPRRFFTCVSKPKCCCFSPNKASAAFIGLDDGSVVVLDFRENSSLQRSYVVGAETVLVGVATFSTAGVLGEENHSSPVVAIAPISNSATTFHSHLSDLSSDGDGLSYQLATVEEMGDTNIWVVIEVEQPDSSGSETELGLCPGGRLKLTRSATIPLSAKSRLHVTPMASCLAVNSQDTNHFYVGTSQGSVLHQVRFGGKCFPKCYRTEQDFPVVVTSIDVSPWGLDSLLVGCKDGSLRLHKMTEENPCLVWSLFSSGSPIEAVSWSRSKPNVFFVVTEDCLFHVWNLLEKKYHPVFSVELKKRVVSMLITNDHSASGQGSPGHKPSIIFVLADNTIEIHHLTNKLTICRGDELDRMQDLLLHLT